MHQNHRRYEGLSSGFKLWVGCVLWANVCMLTVDGKVLLVEGDTHFQGKVIGAVLAFFNVS